MGSTLVQTWAMLIETLVKARRLFSIVISAIWLLMLILAVADVTGARKPGHRNLAADAASELDLTCCNHQYLGPSRMQEEQQKLEEKAIINRVCIRYLDVKPQSEIYQPSLDAHRYMVLAECVSLHVLSRQYSPFQKRQSVCPRNS